MSQDNGKEKVINLFGCQHPSLIHNTENLYDQHKCILKNAHYASIAYQKLASAFFNIKNILRNLEQVYLSPQLPTSSLSKTGIKMCLDGFITSNTKMREIMLENSNKLSVLHQMHLGTVKKHYEKYSQVKQNVQHYRKKVGGLKRSSIVDLDPQRLQRNEDKLLNAQEQHKKQTINLNNNLIRVNKQVWSTCVNSFVGIFCSMGQEYQTSFDKFKSLERKQKMENILEKHDTSHQIIESIGTTLRNILQNGKKEKIRIQSITEAFTKEKQVDFFNVPEIKSSRDKQFQAFENVYCEEVKKPRQNDEREKNGIKIKNVQILSQKEFMVKKNSSLKLSDTDEVNLLDM